MIDVLWNIISCLGLIILVLIGILFCVVLVGCIVNLIKNFKENT